MFLEKERLRMVDINTLSLNEEENIKRVRVDENLYAVLRRRADDSVDKKYVFRGYLHGKEKIRTIGSIDEMSLFVAKRETRRLQKEILNKRKEGDKSVILSLRQVWSIYIQRCEAGGNKYATIKRKTQNFNKLSALHDIPVDQITTDDLYEIYEKMYLAGEHSVLQKLIQECRKIFGIAKEKKMITENPTPQKEMINLHYKMKTNRLSSLDAKTDAGLVDLLHFIEQTRSRATQKTLFFGLLLPLRSKNLRELTLKNLIKINGQYVICIKGEEYKQGQIGDEDKLFGIPEELAEMIQKLAGEVQGEYLFSANNGKTPVSENTANKYIKENFESEYIKGYRQYLNFHSLRSVFSTFANQRGQDYRKVELALGHTIQGVEASYNHSDGVELTRDVLTWWFLHIKNLCQENNIKLF